MNRRQFNLRVTSAGALVASNTVFAQAAPAEGKDYVRINPPLQVSVEPGKIDVVEFFSYACPHCFAFEPLLEAWVKRQPAKVNFHRVPVPFLFNYQNLQPIYYALEALGLVDKMQLKVFNALHIDHLKLMQPEEISALMQKNGVDPVRFMSAFNSFSVQNKVRQAAAIVETAAVTEVPTLIVQGTYKTSMALGGGPEGTPRVLDYLVAKAASGH